MRLFSLGYSGLSASPLTAWLDRHDALLVDVRFKPFSRAPEWRQTTLRRALGDRYVHVPQLGNLNYRGGPIQLTDQAEGVRIVSGLLVKNPVVLLCVCADQARCHRTVAANAVSAATGAEIVHLGRHDVTTVSQLELL